MKSIFDFSTEQEIIIRIQSLSGKSKVFWGKMNVLHSLFCAGMFKHVDHHLRLFGV